MALFPMNSQLSLGVNGFRASVTQWSTGEWPSSTVLTLLPQIKMCQLSRDPVMALQQTLITIVEHLFTNKHIIKPFIKTCFLMLLPEITTSEQVLIQSS